MLERVAYLRLKRLALGPVYERFLVERLAPGGVVVQVECVRDWPVTPVGERAYFQFGCPGGLAEDEYQLPTDRVTRYLAQEGSPRRTWEPPEPHGRRPEAEWGFDPALAADVERVVRENGFAFRRMVTREPDDASPFVADLYRWWYHQLGRPTDRLLVESYVQWDPMRVLRTGSVPFWLRFNTEPDYGRLRSYLESVDPYGEIYLNLFSQGVRSPGVVSAARWEQLLAANAPRAALIGVDRDAYPLDLGSTMRYHEAFARIPERQPVPEPMDVTQVDRFVAEAPPRFDVTWTVSSEARVPVVP